MTEKTKFLNRLRRQLFVGTVLERPLRDFVAYSPPGSWRNRLLPNHDLFPPNSKRTLFKNSRKIEWSINERMEWSAYFEVIDPTILAICEEIAEGQIAIDVGSNIGMMFVAMAKRVGRTGRVYGFEPSKSRFLKCVENIKFHGLDPAYVFHLALGTDNREVYLASPDESNLGRTSVQTKTHFRNGQMESATCLAFDIWAQRNQIRKIDFIKIDVEGFEFQVLKGMDTTLRRQMPKLFVEVDDGNLREHSSSAVEVLSYLSSFGYSLRIAGGDPITISGGNPITISANIPTHFDLIAERL